MSQNAVSMTLHVSRKRPNTVWGGSAMLNDTQNMLSGVMARKPRMTPRMKRYLGIVFSSMMAVVAVLMKVESDYKY